MSLTMCLFISTLISGWGTIAYDRSLPFERRNFAITKIGFLVTMLLFGLLSINALMGGTL